jgi:GNAT superfamily N-acetyltransferase
MSAVTPRFLGPHVGTATLERAVAENHRDRFVRAALAAGGDVREEGGLTVVAKPDEVILAFPSRNLGYAETGALLDGIVDECRRRRPRQVACWSLSPSHPADLGARLAARGFEWGWRPHWMAAGLNGSLREDIPPPPDGLRIEVAEDDGASWDVDDLPYFTRPAAGAPAAPRARGRRRAWRFGAWLDGRVVGQAALHVTYGRLGVAGIYDVGVVPAARGRGIGRAVTLAACCFARDELGACWATLNAAVGIYKRLGFYGIGWGQTWWLHTPALEGPPLPRESVAFAEAVGSGDTAALDALAGSGAVPDDLDAPLPCGLTPLRLAAKTFQQSSAEWLLGHGATPELVPVYELAWSHRIPALLAERPDLVHRRWGAMRLTPLHETVLNDQPNLARLILDHGRPDLSARDAQFDGTPAGWAHHFGRTAIAAMLENG